MVHVLQQRYGMARREEAAATPEANDRLDETQVGFAW